MSTAPEGEASHFNTVQQCSGTRRLIHFDMPWLTTLVVSIAENAEPDTGQALLPPPITWWWPNAQFARSEGEVWILRPY
jgi:hypothetical protein